MRHIVLLALFVTSLVMAGCNSGPQGTKPTDMGGPKSTGTTKPQ